MQGVVSGIGDIVITVQSAEGESLRFIIDASTDFVTETDTDATSLVAGEIVRVQFPFPEFVDGQVVEPAEGSDSRRS